MLQTGTTGGNFDVPVTSQPIRVLAIMRLRVPTMASTIH
jgi:hypothetical protein